MPPPFSFPGSLRRSLESLLHALWFGAGRPARVAATLLTPLTWLTASVSAQRRARIQSLPAPIRPVVVVGNLVVGGTGKTPLAIAIAQGLSARGHSVGMICRGYRAARHDARIVPPDADAGEHGDEAVLLARAGCGPVAAGRHRGEALATLVRAYPALTVVVSDDGLQHPHLPRTVELAVFDRRGAGNRQLLPAGPLRERLATLDRVDAIALNQPAACPLPHPRVYGFRIRARRFVPVSGQTDPIAAERFAHFAAQRRVVALAGIGEPARFFETLNELGIEAQPIALPDHAHIDRESLARLEADLILMTTKDAVKCSAFADGRCWALEVGADTDPRMIDWLAEVLVGHTPA